MNYTHSIVKWWKFVNIWSCNTFCQVPIQDTSEWVITYNLSPFHSIDPNDHTNVIKWPFTSFLYCQLSICNTLHINVTCGNLMTQGIRTHFIIEFLLRHLKLQQGSVESTNQDPSWHSYHAYTLDWKPQFRVFAWTHWTMNAHFA